jgi:hypothetical protein
MKINPNKTNEKSAFVTKPAGYNGKSQVKETLKTQPAPLIQTEVDANPWASETKKEFRSFGAAADLFKQFSKNLPGATTCKKSSLLIFENNVADLITKTCATHNLTLKAERISLQEKYSSMVGKESLASYIKNLAELIEISENLGKIDFNSKTAELARKGNYIFINFDARRHFFEFLSDTIAYSIAGREDDRPKLTDLPAVLEDLTGLGDSIDAIQAKILSYRLRMETLRQL